MRIHRLLRSFLLPLALIAAARAAAPAPELGTKGQLLLEENFEKDGLPAGWNKNTGAVSVSKGVLHASQLAADKHIGAFRKMLPLQDCVLQLDFKLAGATAFHVGFDPAPGELKKKGHLLSLVITPESWAFTEHNDKNDPTSKNVVHAKAATSFALGQWYTLWLEVKADTVIAHIEGKEPLRASAPDFRVKKPGLVFRVGGKDGQEAQVDNVKVWALQ